MATASAPVVLDSSTPSSTRKPEARQAGNRLVISLRRTTVESSDRGQHAQMTETGGPPDQQHIQQPHAVSEERVNTASDNRISQQHRVQPPDDDVIILDSASESESDSDVRIVAVTKRKRPRLVLQQPTTLVTPPGTAVPTWEQQPAVSIAPPSPEPAFKCLICLEGIKSDNMATTPCGHMFCYDCLLDAVKVQKKCPKCRKNVQPKMVKRLYPN